MRSTRWLWLTLFVLGCPKKEEPEAVTPPPPAPAPVVEAPRPIPDAAVEDAGAAPDEYTGLKIPDAGWLADAGTSAAVAVKLFAANCSTTFAAPFDDMGEEGVAPECWARDFDQNCAPDIFKCWDKLEACRDACSPTCDSCQSACAGSCNDCKAKCAGKDAKCVTACAKERQSCRLTCVKALTPCRSACETQEKTCEDVGMAQLKKDCPDCDAIQKCQEQETNDCKAKFPKAAPKCFEQCYVE